MTVWLCIVLCGGELGALASRRGMFTVTDCVLAYPVKSFAFFILCVEPLCKPNISNILELRLYVVQHFLQQHSI